MRLTRRQTTGVVGSMLWLAGCGAAGSDTTASFDIDDIAVENRRSTAVSVRIAGRDVERDETVVDRTVDLSPDGTHTFDDPFADDRRYSVTAETRDGTSGAYDWTGERRDDAGVRILVHPDRIEFRPITA